jgi:hypothetical protein
MRALPVYVSLPIFLFSTILIHGKSAHAADVIASKDATGAQQVTTALQQVTISANKADLIGIAESATEGTVRAKQLDNRPLLRTAELLETVPGMIVTQHSGDGKANQYFLRGYNLDHGSDFATYVLGMPVNVASHAHGQGYMDVNFVIPELIDNIKYRKGVYAAEDGDFSVTGSARIDYQRKLIAPFVDVTLGQHQYRRVLMAASQRYDDFDVLGAVELLGNNGPWDQPNALHKRNALLRLSNGSSDNGYALSAMAYQSNWVATEHVPERAISNGEIGRFGALSANDGGRTHRYALQGEWSSASDSRVSKANLYVVDYGLHYFATPSGFISGLQGDQHEQADQRITWGGEARRSWLPGIALSDSELTVGLQLRQDRVSQVGLYETNNRVRTNTIRQDTLRETSIGLFVEARRQWSPTLRSVLGFRHDLIFADVKPTAGQFNWENGGSAHAGQTSPKLSLAFKPFGEKSNAELYANWGYGFHSNDVRGATTVMNPADASSVAKLDLFAKSKGIELGLRTQALAGWSSTLSLWQMRSTSELVFVGDEGVTEPRGASRRYGLEWSNFVTPGAGISIDTDLAWSHARFIRPVDTNGGSYVPNAIPLTASLGVTLDQGGPWSASTQLRYVGAYALEETNTQKSRPFALLNLKFSYKFTTSLRFSVDILNLLDKQANDIEYWGGACTRSEQSNQICGTGIDGRLIHPLEPRTIRFSLRSTF